MPDEINPPKSSEDTSAITIAPTTSGPLADTPTATVPLDRGTRSAVQATLRQHSKRR